MPLVLFVLAVVAMIGLLHRLANDGPRGGLGLIGGTR